jgi:hypothetical protein
MKAFLIGGRNAGRVAAAPINGDGGVTSAYVTPSGDLVVATTCRSDYGEKERLRRVLRQRLDAGVDGERSLHRGQHRSARDLHG